MVTGQPYFSLFPPSNLPYTLNWGAADGPLRDPTWSVLGEEPITTLWGSVTIATKKSSATGDRLRILPTSEPWITDIHEIKVQLGLFLLSFFNNLLQSRQVRVSDSEIVTVKGSFVKESCHGCNHLVPWPSTKAEW